MRFFTFFKRIIGSPETVILFCRSLVLPLSLPAMCLSGEEGFDVSGFVVVSLLSQLKYIPI